MIDINTLRFAVQLNKLDNSQLPASPLVVEDLLDRIEKAAKEHAALRAELSTEKGWIEDYKKQIVSLQNRLEASEHECTEQARLNGMGASREAALMAKLEAAEKERDALRAKITEMERQEIGFRERCTPSSPTGYSNRFPLYALPGARPQPAPSMPDGWKLAPMVSTYEMEMAGSDHCDGYMSTAQAVWDAMLAAAPEAELVTSNRSPSIPEGWLRAIDEALVVAHIGVANASDTYEQAKAKLDSLIGFHVDVATDPAVNGGWKLMPVEPTEEIYQCFSAYDGTSYSNPFDRDEFLKDWRAALTEAPEAKP